MELNYRILEERDIQNILNFEMEKLKQNNVCEEDQMLTSWSAKWRSEQLQHYTQQGWSMVCYQVEKENNLNIEKNLVGYFIAQPLLYFDGLIQSLWVEHLNSSDLEIFKNLTDYAWKMARDKNFQRIYFSEIKTEFLQHVSSKTKEWNLPVTIINHPKMSTQ